MTRSLFLAMVLLIAGCAGRTAFEDGRALTDAGQYEAGLARLEEAARLEPGNREYRSYYYRQRETALQRYLAVAENARLLGMWEEAENAYRRMLALDAANARATAGLQGLRIERRHRAALVEAEEQLKRGDTQGAHVKVRAVLAENAGHRDAQTLLRRIEERSIKAASAAPRLGAALRRPVTLEFREAALRSVFEMIAKHAGLNFIFDRDVRQDLRTTLFVRNTSIEDVIRFILVTNQLERKVLGENTVLIYPNTAAKVRDYQELVVKSFYLTNADVKQTANMIKALVKTKDMYIDEKLNLLMIRDTPGAVRMAERLVANQDLAEPEVMLEVEVMEVASSALSEIGIRWPDQFSYSVVGAAGTAGTVTLPEWIGRGAGLVRLTVTNPFLVLNLRSQAGRTNLLANPRIRVKNKEKAKVHIGDKVPVITTTTTATGLVSGSVSYLDVGLKLEVEPNVFLEDEVGIKVGLEVSAIAREIQNAAGILTYQVGTRNTSTVLRLKDGETQILAGLINDEDRRFANQVPGLGNLPIVGRLFGSHNNTLAKTEIVLLITPRILRSLTRPEVRFEEFASGTEAAIGAPPLLLQGQPPAETAGGTATTPLSIAAAATKGSPTAAKVQLRAPSEVQPGSEFTVRLDWEADAAFRNGVFDFSFDPAQLKFVDAEPGTLAQSSAPDAGFKVNAPQGAGRATVSISSKTDIRGGGEVVRLRFRALDGGSGARAVRLEALAITDSAGRVVPAQLPPPIGLTLTR